MASGADVLAKMKKLFDKLGVPEGLIKLVMVDRNASVHGPSRVNDPISLGNPILNDQNDRISLGITDRDVQVVRIWGGAIESSGLYQVTQDALIRAQSPGGGVLIFDTLYVLDQFLAGFTVEGVVSQWTLTCTSTKTTR